MENANKVKTILQAIQNITVTRSFFSSKSLPSHIVDAMENYSQVLNAFDWQDYIKSEEEVYNDKTPLERRLINLQDTVATQESVIMKLQKELKQAKQDKIVSDGAFSQLAKKMCTGQTIGQYDKQLKSKDRQIEDLMDQVYSMKEAMASIVFPKL